MFRYMVETMIFESMAVHERIELEWKEMNQVNREEGLVHYVDPNKEIVFFENSNGKFHYIPIRSIDEVKVLVF